MKDNKGNQLMNGIEMRKEITRSSEYPITLISEKKKSVVLRIK